MEKQNRLKGIHTGKSIEVNLDYSKMLAYLVILEWEFDLMATQEIDFNDITLKLCLN